MYDAREVLSAFDDSTALVLAAGSLVLAGALIQYVEGIRLGFRHRTHAIPVVANMYFFAHDVWFVLLYRRWFEEIDHWSYKLFWAALLVFTVLELVVHYQTLRYSRQELAPNLRIRDYVLGYVVLQCIVGAGFFATALTLDDPLFLFHFAITEVLSNMFNIGMLRRRGNRKGQSLLLATGLLIGSNVGFFFFFLPALTANFAVLPVFVLGTVLTMLNLVYMAGLRRAPKYESIPVE